MNITDIYMQAKERGSARFQRHFSEELLGMAPNYAVDTGLVRCSAGAILNLCRRLGELRQPDLRAQAFERLLAVEGRS